jgi:hypothetical protein
LNPAPATLTLLMFMLELPALVSVTLTLLSLVTLTLPKDKLEELELSAPAGEAFTVSTAELLVTFPAAFETTTENCAPLLAVASLGVV